MGEAKVADDILKIFAEGRVDAQSLSAFMEQPSDALVPRRLAQPINTLNYFLDYLQALEKVYTQKTGVVDVNGVQVKAITQAVIDALNSAAIDNNTQVDTLVTATPQAVGMVTRTQADVNSDIVNAKTFGVNSNADSAAIKKAIDYAIATGARIVFNFNVTFKIPSHAPNIQSIIDIATNIGKREFTILIESGHEITKPVMFQNGDYSNFTISSEDAVVNLGSTFPSNSNFIGVYRATGARINCLFDIKDKGVDAINMSRLGFLEILAGCGVKNANRTGAYVFNGSILTAVGAVISGSAGRNLWVSNGSVANVQEADLKSGNKDATYTGSISSRRASIISAQGADFSNTKNTVMYANRTSTINVNESFFDNCSGTVFLVDSGGSISAEYCKLNNCNNIVKAEYGGFCSIKDAVATGVYGRLVQASSGSKVVATTAQVTGTGTGDYAIISGLRSDVVSDGAKISGFGRPFYAYSGSTVSLVDADISVGFTTNSSIERGATAWVFGTKTKSSTSDTVPVVTDFNVVAFNTITTNRGIVWG